MSMTYKTSTGVYSESELAIVVWSNPKISKRPQSRRLETMTSPNSRFPMAFPISSLTKHPAWKEATIAKTIEDIDRTIGETSRKSPIIVSLPLARQALGWEHFYVPTEYVEIED
jgi:hypothetical protein